MAIIVIPEKRNEVMVLIQRLFFFSFAGTYKLKKRTLQAEGFNPTKIQDSLYFLDSKTSEYVPLSFTVYDDIVKGIIRL